MRYEVSQEPKDVEPGDIAVMRLVTTKGAVKWTCGTVRCFTDDDEDPAIVLTTGKIPENDAEIFSLSHWLGVPSDALLGLKPLEVA